jgi:hypothetical protein
MQTAMLVVAAAIMLWVLYGLLRYGTDAQIEVLGVFASDGTRLDRPLHRATLMVPARLPSGMTVSGPAHVTISERGMVIRGPGQVIISG